MRRLSKLQRLTEYLAGLAVTAAPGCETLHPLMSTAQSDATSKLAHLSGIQILIARPEVSQSGNSDSHRDVLSTAIFVIEKNLGLDKTEPLENEQYTRLLEVADAVLGAICDETSRDNCTLVTGLSVASVDVTPEASLFGGWSGYSIELSFD